jgi:hypothetical protein
LNGNYQGCRGLDANAVIRIAGTETAHVTDVEISNLAIINGEPSSCFAIPHMDGIRADYCDRCTFQSLYIHSIAGYYALVWKNSTTIVANQNTIENFYYAGITALAGNQYEWIQNNDVRHAVNRTGDGGL